MNSVLHSVVVPRLQGLTLPGGEFRLPVAPARVHCCTSASQLILCPATVPTISCLEVRYRVAGGVSAGRASSGVLTKDTGRVAARRKLRSETLQVHMFAIPD